jgi:hypothetical protein
VQAPIGGVGGVRDQSKRVEEYVIGSHHGAKLAPEAPAHIGCALDFSPEMFEQRAYCLDKGVDALFAVGGALDDSKIGCHAGEQALTARGGIDEFLKKVGIAAIDQNLADDSHEQARRAPGNATFAQLVESANDLRPQQERYNLPVTGRGVVERHFAPVRIACLRGFDGVRVGRHV